MALASIKQSVRLKKVLKAIGVTSTTDLTLDAATGKFVIFGKGAKMASSTVAALPAAAAGNAGTLMYVTNGSAGAPCIAFSNGTAWKVLSIGATVSAT